jgi:hypothetical protein
MECFGIFNPFIPKNLPFKIMTLSANIIKISVVIYKWQNKQDCVSVASLYSQIYIAGELDAIRCSLLGQAPGLSHKD